MGTGDPCSLRLTSGGDRADTRVRGDLGPRTTTATHFCTDVLPQQEAQEQPLQSQGSNPRPEGRSRWEQEEGTAPPQDHSLCCCDPLPLLQDPQTEEKLNSDSLPRTHKTVSSLPMTQPGRTACGPRSQKTTATTHTPHLPWRTATSADTSRPWEALEVTKSQVGWVSRGQPTRWKAAMLL